LAALLVGEIVVWRRRRASGSASRTFAAEARVTGSSAAALPDIAARLRASADASGNGHSARYLHTLYLPEDERCWYLFEAASTEAVAEAAHESGLALERVLEAYQDPLEPVRADARPPARSDASARSRDE
jgi:hypothetical protein